MPPALSSRLNQLLQNPPGDGISVAQDGDRVEIDMRGGKSGFASVLIKAYYVAMVVSFTVVILAERAGHTRGASFKVLLGFLLASLIFVNPAEKKRRLLDFFRSKVELDTKRVRFTGADITKEFFWEEIESLRVLQMESPDQQLHARLDNPHVQGHGDGIAISSGGTVHKVLDYWHQDVNEWLGDVLSEYSGIPLSGDTHVDRLVAATPQKPYRIEIPSRRKTFFRGVLYLATAVMFSGLSVWFYYELAKRHTWPETAGIVVDLVPDDAEPDGSERLTYEYFVLGTLHDGLFRQTENSEQQYAIGDEVTVRYDPESPDHSTVRMDDLRLIFVMLIPIVATAWWGISAIVASYRIDDSPNEFHSVRSDTPGAV